MFNRPLRFGFWNFGSWNFRRLFVDLAFTRRGEFCARALRADAPCALCRVNAAGRRNWRPRSRNRAAASRSLPPRFLATRDRVPRLWRNRRASDKPPPGCISIAQCRDALMDGPFLEWPARGDESSPPRHNGARSCKTPRDYSAPRPHRGDLARAVFRKSGARASNTVRPPFAGRTCEKSRSEEHTSELQSPCNLVCRLLL